MADIGRLTIEQDGTISGRIRTLTHRLSIELEPIEADDKRSGDAPDFTVYARDGGELIPIGSAWKKTMRDGGKMLSFTLDDPSFSAPLNFAAFEDGEAFRVVWNRPRQVREAA